MKALFDIACDLPAAERPAWLAAHSTDAGVIAEVLALCGESVTSTGRFARPVLDVLRSHDRTELQGGDVLGAWTLDAEIGRGGMSRVFRARRSDGHFQQVAAVKLMSGPASDDALRHFARERQILASLTHPHVARLLDGGSTPNGQPYLVMAHIEGQTIDRYCRARHLGRDAVLALFAQVCSAVAFAHRHLVVHCDLKPSNVLVDDAGHAFLLDFGVSHLLGDADIGQSPAGAAFTPRYASPEQRRGERVGTATDIYSLGMLLAELMGATLHGGAAGDEAIGGLERLPRDLAAIVRRATCASPQARYASVDAFVDDLARFRDHHPVQARERTTRYVAARLLRRHWPWAVAATLFAVTISGFAWRMREQRNAARDAERTALAVKDYMVSVFRGADPEVAGQRDLPVSVLLDSGREKLATTLATQPAERAEIGGILAGVYQNIGQRQQALAMIEEAIALERRAPRPRVLAQLIYQQAYTLYDIEDFPRALPVAEDALARIESLAPGTPEHVERMRLLGGILNYAGEAERARTLLTRALSMADTASGADSIDAARVHLDLARVSIFNEPHPVAAIPHARQALSAIERHGGKDHALYADALEIAALALGNTGDLATALPWARESADRRIALYGEVSNQAGYSLYSYARLLGRAGARRDAIATLERCVHIQEQLDGGATLASEVPITTLAQMLEQAGDLEAAGARLAQSREIRMRLLPEAERDLVALDFTAGRVMRLRGRLDDAARLSGEVLRQRLADPKTHPFRLMQSRLEQAALERERGRFDAADAQLRAIDPASYADEPWRQAFVDLEGARLHAARGDHRQAIAQSLAAEALIEKGLGATHPDLWLARVDRAEWMRSAGDATRARALARDIATHTGGSITPGGYWSRRLDAVMR